MKLLLGRYVYLFIFLLLFFVPVLWLKQGYVDLGGDSSRLYFLDPKSYLESTILSSIYPFGVRFEESQIMYLPFVLILSFVRFFLSSWAVITIFNGIKLSVAFISIFSIVRILQSNLLGKKKYSQATAILAGLLYTLSPVMVWASWDKAIMSQNQFFLNPLIFLLLLNFLKTSKLKFILITSLLTVLFSGNFSWGGAPPFFSFFPIACICLFIYWLAVLKTSLPFKKIIVAFLLTLAMHSFHLLPTLIQLFSKSGTAFDRAFSATGVDSGLNYFLSTALTVTPTKSWFFLPQLAPIAFGFGYLYFIVPLITVIGFFLIPKINKNYKRTYLLFALFFLITFFLVTANVTFIGFDIYKSLFSIPGFSMFRNYYGQWMYIYSFYYSILFGLSLYNISAKLKNDNFKYLVYLAIGLLIVSSSMPFIKGEMIRKVLNPESSTKFSVDMKFPEEYLNFLKYLKKLKFDSKILTLPTTEAYYQMLSDGNNGMYQGPSTISYLSNKADFAGYQTMPPFSEIFLQNARKNDDDFLRLLGVLNIEYIFYNSDPNILKYFKFFPYQHVSDFMPKTNALYKEFIGKIPTDKQKIVGNYEFYKIKSKYFLPHIYSPEKVIYVSVGKDKWGQYTSNFIKESDKKIVYVDKNENIGPIINNKIQYTKLNNTRYMVVVKKSKSNFMLVLLDQYSPNWKIYRWDGKKETKSLFGLGNLKRLFAKPIGENKHIMVNGYANGWTINPNEIGSGKSQTLIIEMTSQRYLVLGIYVSFIAFFVCFLWLAMILFFNKNE